MTDLKHDDVIKNSCDLSYYFGIFERSYVIPLSFQSFIVRAELAQDLSS